MNTLKTMDAHIVPLNDRPLSEIKGNSAFTIKKGMFWSLCSPFLGNADHNFFLASYDMAQDDTSIKSAEAVNLLYSERYKFRYLSQFVKYNCNQGVL